MPISRSTWTTCDVVKIAEEQIQLIKSKGGDVRNITTITMSSNVIRKLLEWHGTGPDSFYGSAQLQLHLDNCVLNVIPDKHSEDLIVVPGYTEAILESELLDD